jgi:hypothetical protein
MLFARLPYSISDMLRLQVAEPGGPLASQTIPRRVDDHKLYIAIAILTPIVVLLGFSRTYYLKGVFGTPALPSLLVHFHGLIMTSWVTLFVVQVMLVATHRTKTHQRLGIAGAYLAALVFVVGTLTGLYASARRSTPGLPPLQFLIVPLGDMFVFAILIGTALYFRRNLPTHKRLMLLGAISLLSPAIARIPFAFVQDGGALAFYGFTDLILLTFVAFDTIKHRRLHPVFIWGTLLIVLSQPLRLLIAGTSLWLKIAAVLVGLVK